MNWFIDKINNTANTMYSNKRRTRSFFVFDTQKGEQIEELKKAIAETIEVRCGGYKRDLKVSITEGVR